MKVYERTENGVTTHVSIREAMAEVNTAMMGGKRDIREMSSGCTAHWIEYKDGRKVRMTLVEVDATEDTEPREWRGTHSRHQYLHRFNESRRARCNRRIHPAYCTDNDKPEEFRTRSEVLAGEYAHLYSFCPKCEVE